MGGAALRVAAVLVAALACGGSPQRRAASELVPAPDFEVRRLDGSVVRLDDFRGRYLLIDFWATWCPPCVLEVPELNAFRATTEGSGDVELLAISIDVLEPSELADWTRERGVAYPVALGSEETALRYGARAFPFHVLVSPAGEILEALDAGFHDRDELLALLARHRPDPQATPQGRRSSRR